MRYFVVAVRLKPGSVEKVREILREGPPFDLEQTSLERHLVFLGGDELIFFFEGGHADEKAKQLLASCRVLGQASRIGVHIEGTPRLPEEVFGWERLPTFDGVTFEPHPGPGDSEGGPVE
jgi:hypothetical protein